MKISFVIDSDKEFTSFAERNLTLHGFNVSVFSQASLFFNELKSNVQLIIVGEMPKAEDTLQYIKRIRSVAGKSKIIHIAKTTERINLISSNIAGSTEFIERDGATFVRLRTSLDEIQKEETTKKSVLHSIKKAILG